MELYHYIHDFNEQSIREKGLIFPKVREEYNDTADINYYLDQYKPMDFPTFMDRNQCVFFWSYKRYEKTSPKRKIALVNSMDLDSEKLYIFRHDYAHAIWQNVVDAPWSGKTSNYTNEEAAELYWQSGIKLDDVKEEKLEKYEVLYFGEIEPEKIKII
jgi:hypothetical protein